MVLESSREMFESGRPLMRRVLPDDPDQIRQWDHYPDRDVVNGKLKSRWFYHCHPPEERKNGEHGHFHLFVDRAALPEGSMPLVTGNPGAKAAVNVVHIAALSIAPSGLPTAWFTVNRWVTDEWLYPADVIAGLLSKIDFRGPRGDSEVNRWLTGMVALYRPLVLDLLNERDAHLQKHDMTGDNRRVEIVSSALINLADQFAE
jgi:hypothetical protein